MMKQKNNIARIHVLCFLLFFFCNMISAQEVRQTIEGSVSDDYGNPLTGALIYVGEKRSTGMTDVNGNFSFEVDETTRELTISYLGYSSETVEITTGEAPYEIVLKEDAAQLDKKVELGYSAQTKRELTGAVSTVTGEELLKSPVANLTQTFQGRLSGLSTRETSSELSRANTSLYIRGRSTNKGVSPLVVVDGMIVDYNANQTMEYISAAEIESISVLKDASTQALYGIQGANGVIVITTKRGISSGLKINTRFDQSFQQVTTKPMFINSWEYAELRNEAIQNDYDAGKITSLGDQFTSEEIENFRSGENRTLYPNNNWYDMYMKPLALMERVNLDVTGGNERVQFYSNMNMMYQGGQYKTDPEQTKYNPAPNNLWFNFRTNVDMKINSYLSTFLRLSGNVKREHTPGNNNVAGIYSGLFTVPSTIYGPVTPPVIDEETGEVLDPGGVVVATDQQRSPVYGELNRRGYYNHTVTNVSTQFGVNLNLDYITKGLDLDGIFAYQTNSVGHYHSTQDYARVQRTGDLSELSFSQPLGSNQDTPLGVGKSASFYYHLTYMGKLNYERLFGKHKVTGLAYALFHNLIKADTASPWSLPYNRVNTGIDVTYGYDDRYFVKGTTGYSGSEQFPRNNRYTSTPAISAAWLVSNESFLKDVDWLNMLKIRASHGKTGNDIMGLNRYAYLDDVTVSGGGYLGYLQYSINERNIGNQNINPEIITKNNVGIDLGFLDLLSFSIDVYNDKMDNMMINAVSTIPAYQGVPLGYYPSTNSGVFENQGYEVSANFAKRINKDLHVSLGGFFDYNKNKVINVGEAERTEDYAYRKRSEGFPLGQSWGYLVDYSNGNGMYNSQEEIDNFGLPVETEGNMPRVGDLKYQDLNNDGIIDVKDEAPIGKGSLIPMYYGFSGAVQYKSFDLSFLFQGASGYSTITSGLGIWEMYYLNIFSSLHKNAWTPERYESGAEITYPALSTQSNTNHKASDYFEIDRSYLRLKNVELSYTLPDSFSRALKASKTRIIFSGQNLLTWDNMKSKDFGPEGNYNSLPVYRVYNIGVNVQF